MICSIFSMNVFAAETEKKTDTEIEDGVYHVTVNLRNFYEPDMASMGNNAVRGSSSYNEKHASDDAGYQPLLIVENGKGTLIMEYMPMGYLNSFGYLLRLDTLDNISYQYNLPDTYDLVPAAVLTEHRMTDGSMAFDVYNDPESEWVMETTKGKVYPRAVAVPIDLPEQAVTKDDETPFVHVYVPVMASINADSGDQLARLNLDYSNMTKVDDLSGETEYWLYKAMNVEKGGVPEDDWKALQSAVSETKEKLSNTLVSITLQKDLAIRTAKEPDEASRKELSEKLRAAIQKAEAFKWDGSTRTAPVVEEKTAYITTASELAWAAEQVNSGVAEFDTVKLMNDIYLNYHEWTPIGTKDCPYTGTFDGNGYTVKELSVKEAGNYKGLFGYVCGTAEQKAEIKNVSVYGALNVSGSYFGGIAGYAKYANIVNCKNYADITLKSENPNAYVMAYAGGIVGQAANAAVKGCINNGNVAVSGNFVGGISGCASVTDFTDCINNKVVAGKGFTAGIVGMVQTSSVMEGLANNGNIEGTTNVGGVMGSALGAAVTAYGICNRGTVKGNGGGAVGGLAAAVSNTTIAGAYSTGTIGISDGSTETAAHKPGSLIGNFAGGTLEHAFALVGSSAKLTSQSTTGVTIAFKTEMWFKNDMFYEEMGDYAKYFSADVKDADGYPYLTATVTANVREEALTELDSYKEEYKGLAKEAIDEIKETWKMQILGAASAEDVQTALAEAKAALDEIPNDANYGLDLTALKEKLEELKAEAEKGSYTEESQKALEDVIAELELGLEEGFGTQENVETALKKAEQTVSTLVQKEEEVPTPDPTPTPTPDPIPAPSVAQDPTPSQQTPDATQQTVLKKGDIVTVKGLIYKVTAIGKSAKVTVVGSKNKNAKKVSVPASVTVSGVKYKVTEIGAKAFRNHKKLTGVTISKNITKIGKRAFSGDKKLKNITIKSKKIKTVGKNAFYKVNKKVSVKLPKGLSKKKKTALVKKLNKAGVAKTAKIK